MRLNLSCKKKIPDDDYTTTCFIRKFNECLFVDVTNSNLFLKLRKAVIQVSNVKWSCFVEVEVQNQLFWPR